MPDINFTAADWVRIRRDYTAWWRGELDRPLLYFSNVFDGPVPADDDFYGFLSMYPPEVAPAEIVRKYVAHNAARVFKGDAYPFFFINFGPGILAGPLGARVNATFETTWFEPPPGAALSSLRIRMDRENHWWRRILAVTKAAAESIGRTIQISYTDLGGNLDILASLVGTESLLAELIDRPAMVDKAAAAVTKEWLSAFDELDALIRPHCPGTNGWASIWAPGSSYMLQSDFSYMISPAMFKRFVMPDLEACCGHIEYPFYHLDGIGEIPHLDHLLSLEKLRGIQWIFGDGKPPAEHWMDLYRRIKAGGKLIQVTATVEGARKICREVGGKGFTFSIWDAMSPAEADRAVEDVLGACR